MANPNSIFSRPKSLRAALLGAVAVAAVGGFALESLPLASNPAIAASETLATQAAAPTSIAPTSFADVVDHVKGAVVSVKVKMVEDGNVAFRSNNDGDQEQGQGQDQGQGDLQNLPPGIQKFFREFGAPGMQMPHGQMRPHIAMAQGSGFFITR